MPTLTPEQIQSFASQRLGLREEAERAKRRLQEDYDLQSRLTTEQSARDQQQVRDQMASQGLAGSGIMINEQGQVERRTNEALSQYGLSRARGLEDVGFGLTRNLAGIDEAERGALAEAGRREREDAIQRALLEAQTRVPVVQPPPMPNPVIWSAPPPPQIDMQAMLRAAMYGPSSGFMDPSRMRGYASMPTKATGWNSGVGGAPRLTPLRGRY